MNGRIASVERAERRLRDVRALPERVERSFRSAIRETLFLLPRGGAFATTLQARALAHLDELIGPADDATERERARTAMRAVVARFCASRLCERLRRLSAERLFAPMTPACDLLVCGRDGRRFAVNFVVVPTTADRTMRPRGRYEPKTAIDETVVYDLRTGAVARTAAAKRPHLLCA